MQINKINSTQNFKGIFEYKGTKEVEKPHCYSITNNYNYYPFIDETPEESYNEMKEEKGVSYYTYRDPKTGKKLNVVETTNVVKKDPINLTKADYKRLLNRGCIDIEILNHALTGMLHNLFRYMSWEKE